MTINELLTVDEMYRADAATVGGGVPSLELMEAAGQAIAEEIQDRWKKRPVAILCGPGNNGGDGFVVACLLVKARWPITVSLLGEHGKLTGDAAINAERWQGDIEPLSTKALEGDPLVVDALFGAGLTRPLDGVAREIVETINARRLDCVAVDIPSGVHGDNGEILGAAPFATLTVTFFRAKPGHVLLPGRVHCGALIVADIGIPEMVLDDIRPQTFVNGPSLWLENYPWPRADAHKYSRGHAVVAGGETLTGAARLAAYGARRIGAGLVTIAAPLGTFEIYAADRPGTLVKTTANTDEFRQLLDDPRKNAVLVGPGAGVSTSTRERVIATLSVDKGVVLDADVFTVFEDDPGTLLAAITGDCLLTPHEGEFARVFDVDGDKLSRARAAARESGAVLLVKGPDTVIAAPDGRAVINASGSPDLATAGTGDVLAGMALGLITQGMDLFGAAAAATWLHGAAAEEAGPGMIAEDLPDTLPLILARLLNLKAGARLQLGAD